MTFTSSRLSLQQIFAACLLSNFFTISSAVGDLYIYQGWEKGYCLSLSGHHEENGQMSLVFHRGGESTSCTVWEADSAVTPGLIYTDYATGGKYCIALDEHHYGLRFAFVKLFAGDFGNVECAKNFIRHDHTWVFKDADGFDRCVVVGPISDGGRANLTLSPQPVGDDEHCSSPWSRHQVPGLSAPAANDNSSGVPFRMQGTIIVAMIFYAILGSLNMA